MNKDNKFNIPSWLEEAPTEQINPPVETRLQELPFEQLTWENFERLCLRLARLEANVEYCQLYGERGNNQEGIDIYARQNLSEKYIVYQCKRVNEFGPAKIKSAVAKFIQGNWLDKTENFILCTQESLGSQQRSDEIENQSLILRQKGIKLIIWDSRELNIKLKEHHNLVEEFFGKAWVIAFCSLEKLDSSSISIDIKNIFHKYKDWLIKTTANFIILGINKKFSIETDWIQLHSQQVKGDSEIFKAEFIPELYRMSVVIGDPGSGKTTLIEHLAHQLSVLGKKVLRVRLKSVSDLCRNEAKTFEDAIFKAAADKSNCDEKKLQLALNDPEYLLVDGLDECEHNRGNIAKMLTSWAKSHTKTRIVLTTRINYELELFPEWDIVEIVPLKETDIIKFAKIVFESYSSSIEQIEEEKNAFNWWLKNTKTDLLAAKNPLLLCFLIQLFKTGANNINNRTSIYQQIIREFIDKPLLDREPVNFAKRYAQSIIKLAGWKLLNEPDLSEDQLIKRLIDELKLQGYTQKEAEEQAIRGISFWENCRIFERTREGYQEVVNFIHLSLCEYAAGNYVADLDDDQLYKWLYKVRQDTKWRETILFAAGLSKGEIIVKYLLEFDNQEDRNSHDILLAVRVLAEVDKLPVELIEAVFNRLKLRLESPVSSVVFEAVDSILSFSSKIPKLIGNSAKLLSKHTQTSTSIAAIRLALACGEDYVDLGILENVLNNCIDELVKIITTTNPFVLRRRYNSHKNYERECQEQVLIQGFQLLIKKQPDIITAKRIEQVIFNDNLSVGIHIELQNMLSELVKEQLKSNEAKKEWQDILSRLINFDQLFASFKPENFLKDLKLKKITKLADKAFLESVIRATAHELKKSLLPQQSQDLIALGILFKGMGWCDMGTCEWDILSKCQDLDAIDAVIKGEIAAMKIDPQRLAMEAISALEYTNHFLSYNLDDIEAALQTNKNKEKKIDGFEWALQQLIEIDQDFRESRSFYSMLPKVPCDPKWELAKEIDISPRYLVQALKHPSQGIYQNATLLLMHGAGGSEAIQLIEELLKENKDNEQVCWAVSNIAPHLLEDEELK